MLRDIYLRFPRGMISWTFLMQLYIKTVFIVKSFSSQKFHCPLLFPLPPAFMTTCNELSLKPTMTQLWNKIRAHSMKKNTEEISWILQNPLNKPHHKCYLFSFVFRIILCCWLSWFTLGNKKNRSSFWTGQISFKIQVFTYGTTGCS